jgi:hypothetical protein
LPILYPATLNPELPPIPTQITPLQPVEILFVGNLNWLPNADAMKWFLNQIWPIVAKQNHQVRLTIIGKPCEFFQLQPKVAVQRVKFIGFVDQLEPYLAKAQISILPFRMGGGVRFKALTAAWAGHAIVSTSLGIQGLKMTPGLNCLVADSALDFANQLLSLIDQPTKIQLLAHQAQAYLKTEHSLAQYRNFWSDYTKIG